MKITPARAFQVHHLMRFCTNILLGICAVKMGVAQAEIGKFEWIMLLSSVSTMFWVSGWLGVLPAQYVRVAAALRFQYLGLVFGFIVVFGLIFGLIFGFFIDVWAGVYVFFGSIAFFFEYYLLAMNKSRALVAYSVGSVVVVLGVGLLPLYGGHWHTAHGLLVGVAAAAAGRCALGAVVAGQEFFVNIIKNIFVTIINNINPKNWGITRHQTTHQTKKTMYTHATLAVALGGSLALGSGLDFFNAYIIKTHLSPAQLAIYRYGAREMPLVSLLAHAFSVAYTAQFATQTITTACQQLKIRSQRLINYLMPVSIILMLTSADIFTRVFDESYRSSAHIFNVFLLLGISRLVFPQTILNGLQKNHILFHAAIIEVCTNAIFAVILLPHWGIVGVAWATLIAFFTEKIYLICYLYFKNHLPPTQYIATKPLGIWAALLFLAYFWG